DAGGADVTWMHVSSPSLYFTAEVAGRVVASTMLERRFAAPGVTKRDVRDGEVTGVFFTPASPGHHPGCYVSMAPPAGRQAEQLHVGAVYPRPRPRPESASSSHGGSTSERNGASWVSSRCCQACAGLLPWDPQEGIRLRASLARARLVAVRPGAHTVTSDCSKNNRDYALSCGRGHLHQQAVKGRQSLTFPLQAPQAQPAPVLQCGLGHGRPEQVVDEQMAPDLLPPHPRRLAP